MEKRLRLYVVLVRRGERDGRGNPFADEEAIETRKNPPGGDPSRCSGNPFADEEAIETYQRRCQCRCPIAWGSFR